MRRAFRKNRGAPEMPISGDSDVRSETVSKISSEEPDASAMGKEMTDRLATRLEAAPHDADGWLRLMRAPNSFRPAGSCERRTSESFGNIRR